MPSHTKRKKWRAKQLDQKRVVAVDFNGTIASGRGPDPESWGEPEPGAKEALAKLRDQGYHVAVNSVVGDREAIQKWLDEHGIEVDGINESPAQPDGSSGKLNAGAYIDDRAISYRGNWQETLEDLRSSGVMEKRLYVKNHTVQTVWKSEEDLSRWKLGPQSEARIEELKRIGDKLKKHIDPAPMPGYGQIFLANPQEAGEGYRVWYVGGDGDEKGFSDVVRGMLEEVDGIEDITIEAEHFPPRDGRWMQVYPKERAWLEETRDRLPPLLKSMTWSELSNLIAFRASQALKLKEESRNESNKKKREQLLSDSNKLQSAVEMAGDVLGDRKLTDTEKENRIKSIFDTAIDYMSGPLHKALANGVVLTPEKNGWDVSAYVDGEKVQTTWKYDQSSAMQAATTMANFYEDNEGQITFSEESKSGGNTYSYEVTIYAMPKRIMDAVVVLKELGAQSNTIKQFAHGQLVAYCYSDLERYEFTRQAEIKLRPFIKSNIYVKTLAKHLVVKALHKFSSTSFRLKDAGYSRSQGSPIAKLKAMAAQIPDEDLTEEGREDDFHVTVKYGLHTTDPDEVAKAVNGFGPVVLTLGKTSLFHNEDADVVKIDVESDDLVRLNKIISDSLEHTDTRFDYQPHVTLAYVKPGQGDKCIGMDDVEGYELNCVNLQFSDTDKNKTMINLMAGTDSFDRFAQLSKAMSAYNETTGGALVPPPQQGKRVKLRRNVSRRELKQLRLKYRKGLFSTVESAGRWLAAKWEALESRCAEA